MIKKFFRNLTLSSEERRRERAQNSLHGLANSLKEKHQQLAKIARLIATAKLQVDSCESLHKAGEKQGVDFDALGEAVCDQARHKITELSKFESELSSTFAMAEKGKLDTHLSDWTRSISELQCAYGSLRRAASEKFSDELEKLTNQPDTAKPLGQAVEALLLEVRTVERIRAELGG